MTRLLVIMGSGETTPTMIKTHRRIFEGLPAHSTAVLMDTPYGFQLNADEISAKAVGYFAQSVGRRVDVVSWRRDLPPGLARERALAELRAASWIFAGPGSPSYTLKHWQRTELPKLLAETDVLVFASAAALTLGSHTIPVYEIYKAGTDPHWLPGFNLFEQLTGVPAVVIPHYDNAEGGHHDTRFCYLGEPRLAALERELPAGSVIVGVDEHTALLCDLTARTVTVAGNGCLTLRRAGVSSVFPTGTVLSLAALTAPNPTTPHSSENALDPVPGPARSRETLDAGLNETRTRDAAGAVDKAGGMPGQVGGVAGTASVGRVGGTAGTVGGMGGAAGNVGVAAGAAFGAAAGEGLTVGADSTEPSEATSLRQAADRAEVRFVAALDGRDADGCVAAWLDLEQAIQDWTADTLTSDDGPHARSVLRSMAVRLGTLAASGTHDLRPQLAPLVEALLEQRRAARELRDWPAADRVRHALQAAGVAVQDTPTGQIWTV
jgi:hypothetical protein